MRVQVKRCSALIELISVSHSLAQLALTFRELWKISWWLRGAMGLVSLAWTRLSPDRWSGKALMQITTSIGLMTEP